MRTKSNGSKHSLSFEKNANVDRAKEAAYISIRKFIKEVTLGDYTFCFDEHTEEVLFFIRFETILTLDLFTTQKFYSDLKQNWKNAEFEVVDDRLLGENTFPQIAYASRMFRLKNLK